MRRAAALAGWAGSVLPPVAHPLKAAGACPEPIPQEWTIIPGIWHSCAHASRSPPTWPHESSPLQRMSGINPNQPNPNRSLTNHQPAKFVHTPFPPSSTQETPPSTMSFFTPTTMALQSLLYLTLWQTTTHLVQRHGPSTTIAPLFTKLNSRLYSLLSLLLFLLIILSPSQHDSLARTLFHLSKFYEYIDLLGVAAAGSTIDLHFGFHHLTTPWLTFVRVLSAEGCEGWRWFGAANTAHHGLMYAYFGGWQAPWVREVLLWTGQVQLGIGMVADGWVVGKKLGDGGGIGEVWRFLVSGALLGVYWVLQRREMRLRAEDVGKKQVKGKAARKASAKVIGHGWA